DLPRWLPAVVAIGLILTINLFGVSKFGETEFWFALIKVVAILCLVIIGAILVAGHFVSPDGDRAAFENLWNDGGFFATGFMGVVSGF
ncbi:D-serine/D-alanine/glycine transporter, partial [Mycobacterium kansasii]